MKTTTFIFALQLLLATEIGRAEIQPIVSPKTNTLGMRLVWMPAVHLWVSSWETRVVDYAAFVADTGRAANTNMFTEIPGVGEVKQGDWWLCPGFPQTMHHPVVSVTADDADAFCSWLTLKERAAGMISKTNFYRLPNGDEWADIYRTAGVKPVPEKGDGLTNAPTANVASEELRSWNRKVLCPFLTNYFDGFARTSPVGLFPASDAGIFDLEGNVKEWCADIYPGDPEKKLRTLSGTGWTTGCGFGPKIGAVVPSQPTAVFGFRVVLSDTRSGH